MDADGKKSRRYQRDMGGSRSGLHTAAEEPRRSVVDSNGSNRDGQRWACGGLQGATGTGSGGGIKGAAGSKFVSNSSASDRKVKVQITAVENVSAKANLGVEIVEHG